MVAEEGRSARSAHSLAKGRDDGASLWHGSRMVRSIIGVIVGAVAGGVLGYVLGCTGGG
ncbi:MAG: hypothetical protein KJ579_06465 [Verrucomicrobia bacterium]|nr:hypothetical protein [Verrucomicrobiota bacterium]